jgi:asparagine synthase (glutamine-hydrolysing)
MSLKPTGDTEVILKSFVEWGEGCLKMFEGDFALAIWDIKKRKLFLARDRFGVKPLYFSKLKETFRFGSTLQAIIANKDINLELSPKALPYALFLACSCACA